MSQSRTTPRSAGVAPLHAAQPQHRPGRRRAGALLMGTALSAIVGLGYGGAYGQQTVLSGTQTDTQTLTGPGDFVTEDGFSVDTTAPGSGGNAITITTASGVTDDTTFNDNYSSSITGADHGVFAENFGSGALSITTSGTVIGRSSYGIYATNKNFEERATDVSVSAYNVSSYSGNDPAIDVENRGTGDTSITVTGSVSAIDDGVAVDGAYYGGGSMYISVVDISSEQDRGIFAINRGEGYTNIEASGTITSGGSGIVAQARKESQGFNVIANNVTSLNGNGLEIENRSYADARLTVSGLIDADDAGIKFSNRGSSSGNTYISVNNINAGREGIDLSSSNGLTQIQVSGTIDAGRDGIEADTSGGAITINANTVIGGRHGIEVDHGGTDAVTITTTGEVTGGVGYNGIYASNSSTGTELTITANTVTGGTTGIYADNDGSGALSITTTGTVTGSGDDGIYAYNSSDGTDLTIVADTVTGGTDGIFANNDGSGALSITANGTVTGTASNGIDADNSDNGTNLMINVSDVRGDGDALTATNRGNGYMSVLATGEVYSASGRGIDVVNDNGTSLSISANNVTAAGSQHGIFARNDGSGNLNITSRGTITAGSDGVNALVDSVSTGDAIISVNDISAEFHGIEITNRGSGSTTIEVNGTVESGTQDGIYANNKTSTEDLTITINEGGSVSTSGTDASDWAIEADASNGAVIVNNFGTVTGRVNLTNSNTFTNAGTWDLAGTKSNFNAQGNSLVVNEGLIIAASDASVNEWPWLDNLDTFRNTPGGTIRLADGGAGDVFKIGNSGGQASADFVANGGTVELDVVLGGDGSAADRLDISGDVILDGAPTALAINSVGGGTGGETTTGIEVVTVSGSSDAGAFVLAGPAEVGALSYDLSLGQCDDTADGNWYLCNNGTIGTTATVFEAMPGIVLNTFARSETLQQRLGARVTSREMATVTASTRGAADLPVAQTVGPWVRSWGDFAEITPDTSTAGTRWEADSWGFEAGIGSVLGDHAGGRLVGGINLRYGVTNADLSNPAGTASLDTEGFGLAASLTWFGNDGFYVDGTAAVDFVSIDATSQGGGLLLDGHDDVVYSASLEVGQRFELQGGTTLVPQVQLSWGRMRDGTLTDSLGNVVSFADRETLTSRIGLTVEQDLSETDLGAGAVFAFANVLNDLSGSRTVTVAGTDLTQSGTGDWLELGGGFSVQSSETTNLFGQVSYREAFDGVSGDAVAVSAGLRMEW